MMGLVYKMLAEVAVVYNSTFFVNTYFIFIPTRTQVYIHI